MKAIDKFNEYICNHFSGNIAEVIINLNEDELLRLSAALNTFERNLVSETKKKS